MINIAKLVLLVTVGALMGCGGSVSKSPKKAVGGQGQPCSSDGSCAPMLTCVDDVCQTPPDNNTNVLRNNTNVRPNNTNVDPNNTNITPNNTNVMNGFCGDGFLDVDESCDGSELNDESCITFGYDGGALFCTSNCSFDDSNCFFEASNVCGNFIVEPPEVCEQDELRGESCRSQGFDGGELGCGSDCFSFDTSQCFVATCGNDVIEGGELCDGGALGGQTCESQGFDGGELGCNSACAAYDTAGCWQCGNGRLEPGEDCDGNDFGGQTCQNLGLGNGQLRCSNACELDVSACGDTPPVMCELPQGCSVNDPTNCACFGCLNDGVCNDMDDCVCPDCETNTALCPDSSCNNNGRCDPFTENCDCADCAGHAQCSP